MLQPGQIVGSYRILRPLGQGGMGAVFAAEHELIGRRAAIKVLHATHALDPSAAGRFLNEARAVNLVEHPGLVQIYEYGLLPEGGAYIVMEYLEGETLRGALRRRPLQPAEATAVGLQIAEALAAAHARDIIHRDLKPDNVMLVRDASRAGLPQLRVKVLDFGLAKLISPAPGSALTPGHAATPRTRTGMAVGTPEYMSPEQCKGQPVDGRSDCYALGALLYELLTGSMPYVAPFAFDLMRLHVHGPIPTLPETVPAPLRALVRALLAKDPAQRPTMAQVAERLRLLVAALPPAQSGDLLPAQAAGSGRSPRAAEDSLGVALQPTLAAPTPSLDEAAPGALGASRHGAAPAASSQGAPRHGAAPAASSQGAQPDVPSSLFASSVVPPAQPLATVRTALRGLLALAVLVLVAKGVPWREGGRRQAPVSLAGGAAALAPAPAALPPAPAALPPAPAAPGDPRPMESVPGAETAPLAPAAREPPPAPVSVPVPVKDPRVTRRTGKRHGGRAAPPAPAEPLAAPDGFKRF